MIASWTFEALAGHWSSFSLERYLVYRCGNKASFQIIALADRGWLRNLFRNVRAPIEKTFRGTSNDWPVTEFNSTKLQFTVTIRRIAADVVVNFTYYFISLLPAISSNGIGAQFDRIRPLQSDFSNFYFFFFFFYNTFATSSLRPIHEEPVSNRFITAIMRGIFRSRMEKLYSKERDFYRRTFIFPCYLVIASFLFLREELLIIWKYYWRLGNMKVELRNFSYTHLSSIFLSNVQKLKMQRIWYIALGSYISNMTLYNKNSKEPNQVVFVTRCREILVRASSLHSLFSNKCLSNIIQRTTLYINFVYLCIFRFLWT